MSHWKRNLLAVLALGVLGFGSNEYLQNQEIHLSAKVSAAIQEFVDESEGIQGIESMSGEGEHPGEASLLHLLKGVFSSAMDFGGTANHH